MRWRPQHHHSHGRRDVHELGQPGLRSPRGPRPRHLLRRPADPASRRGLRGRAGDPPRDGRGGLRRGGEGPSRARAGVCVRVVHAHPRPRAGRRGVVRGPGGLGHRGCALRDGAAAFVLCNVYGMPQGAGRPEGQSVLRLWEWGSGTTPDTRGHMSFCADPRGFRAVLTREVASLATKAIRPLFDRLLPSFRERTGWGGDDVVDFDWALHPGGQAIIARAQELLGLTDGQLRATKEVYTTRGNCSSAAVLMVLDSLRKMDRGKDAVVATSFGAGLCIEMASFTRGRIQGGLDQRRPHADAKTSSCQ